MSDTGRSYNYRHFRFTTYGADVDRNASAGRPAVDGCVSTLDGDEIQLSQLWQERPIVIEFGSITCPIFVENVDAVDALAERYAGDVLYVREAHPGNRYGPHQNFTEKATNARDAKRDESIERTVLVDDIDGPIHRAYDSLPNSVYVIGRDGVVSYRADWTDPDALDEHLASLLANGGRGADVTPTNAVENFHRPTLSRLRALYRVTRRAGAGSFRDFVASLPDMLRYRLRQ